VPVTINDVAKRLQLSVTTVSRALAGYDDVAHETRLRVIRAAREMGYVPKRAARQLRLQRAETLGLIFPTLGARFSDPFFSEFMAGVGDGASQHSYDLLVSVAPPGEAEQQTYQLWAHSGRVDGFILVRMRIEDWRLAGRLPHRAGDSIRGFRPHGDSPQRTPYRCRRSGRDPPHIGVDGRAGILDLMRHLISLGHRRIAFISAPEALTFATERLQGYRQGLEEAGLTWDPSWLAQGDLTRQGGYQAALRLLDLAAPDRHRGRQRPDSPGRDPRRPGTRLARGPRYRRRRFRRHGGQRTLPPATDHAVSAGLRHRPSLLPDVAGDHRPGPC